MQLIPSWAVGWYLVNLMVLPYDSVYVIFRPASSGNSFGNMVFSPIHWYAKFDKVFGDPDDMFVFYIYIIGIFDMLASLFIFITMACDSKAKNNPKLAALSIVQSSELATKTLLYLMHSFHENGKDGRELSVRVAITMMNAAFVAVPVALILSISDGLQKAITAKKRQD